MVFDDYNDMAARIDSADLDVDANSVLILRNAGPLGGPGMPEWGMLPIPKKLLKQGVRDMVRISDARMSGTSYGTCVLHVSPESWIGGPLALVRTGRHCRAGCAWTKTDPESQRRGTCQAPRCLETKGKKICSRLRQDFFAARLAGRQGLRFRFSGRHRPDSGAGDPLRSRR
jgi:hypothetical protein